MEKKFKSKVGWWYYLALLFSATATIFTFIRPNNFVKAIPLLLLTLLLMYIWLFTNYRITNNGWLIVQSGIFYKKKVAITDITAITSAFNPLSSPALSLDRLEIRTGKKIWNIISPQSKEEFVKLLKKINPQIEVKGMNL